MVLIFTWMFLAFVAGWFRLEKLSLAFCFLSILFLVAWFLFEVYNPQTGFVIPWLSY